MIGTAECHRGRGFQAFADAAQGASFRLIVTSNMGAQKIERLIKETQFDKEILAEREPENKEAAN